jgi:hypothetical protein
VASIRQQSSIIAFGMLGVVPMAHADTVRIVAVGASNTAGKGVGTEAFQRPDVSELIAIDVTNLSVKQAAQTIVVHLDGLRATLQPATLQHLRMTR